MFGFELTGDNRAVGVIATALTSGLTLLALAYVIGPVSGCHVNPAVTAAFVVAGRMRLAEAAGYWVAQIAGGLAGAGLLAVILRSASRFSDGVGLGANGYGRNSMIGQATGSPGSRRQAICSGSNVQYGRRLPRTVPSISTE